MTPPDSGERNPFLSRNAQWLRDNDTKPQPDSGEREVDFARCRQRVAELEESLRNIAEARSWLSAFDRDTANIAVTISADLAQRILAHMAEVDSALGSDDWKPDQPLRATLRALIGELRERLPK